MAEEGTAFTAGQPGRVDPETGLEWWACDPYPTWYRYEDGQLQTRGYWPLDSPS